MDSRLALAKRWQVVTACAAAAMAVTEVVSSIGNEVAWAGFVFAALFAAGAVLIFRGVALRAGLILVAALCTVELAFIPFYTRETVVDWILEAVTLLFSAIGLFAAVASILVDRRSQLAHR
jgi:hypothetical protein